MATLLPWNFFITPFAYWMTKLQRSDWKNQTSPDTMSLTLTNISIELGKNQNLRIGSGAAPPATEDNCTNDWEFNPLQKFWSSTLAISTMGTNLIFCFLTTILAKKIPRKTRFLGCLLGYVLCLSATLAMVRINFEDKIPVFFGTTMGIVVLITICCAVFQTSLFGLASEFPMDLGIMGAVMGGQGCGGIFACVVNLLTLGLFDDPLESAFIFFLLAIVFTLFGIFMFLRIIRHPLYIQHVHDGDQKSMDSNAENVENEAMLSDANITFGDFVKTTLWPYMLSVFLCFVVTLGLFPAVAAFVQPINYDCNNVYHTKWFQPIWCFTLFNVGDTIGRVSASKVPFPKPQESMKLLTASIVRFGFVFLLPLCNIVTADRSTSIVFYSDWVYIIIMAAMSLSGGIISTQAMSFASQIAPRHLSDDVGNTMGTSLVAGLCGGAAFSFLILFVM
ncbi:Oidioi.mRNA.OKI2018_I69.XSR.g14032.t1.cds [Oikopleura dioica]|uniref:Oidioi.mRNA.OKI2018_I69.XSR.g14032.t1.cds n=1 Tax=Oikopleura dioica TaxID=34765 RepID=A0ABN7S954_OIKDI|nr:Oidioi.mRNA.OKI2018_I69.XSR.g14032.t1.cds [Oikopleura dioica]